jgi:hypothetical protein
MQYLIHWSHVLQIVVGSWTALILEPLTKIATWSKLVISSLVMFGCAVFYWSWKRTTGCLKLQLWLAWLKRIQFQISNDTHRTEAKNSKEVKRKFMGTWKLHPTTVLHTQPKQSGPIWSLGTLPIYVTLPRLSGTVWEENSVSYLLFQEFVELANAILQVEKS